MVMVVVVVVVVVVFVCGPSDLQNGEFRRLTDARTNEQTDASKN